ncbi:MAG TPA: 6-hydroxymethylpterin diphosphokinase MptE-like protein, partial [Magnetospirillaceae bacterium]|nr:6-hydroxymethylpterin diphosphokinase MptE-like protein [Magnetospirillaceae bacterium]
MNGILRRNLLAVSSSDPALAGRVSAARPDPSLSWESSRSGLPVPVLIRDTGTMPLHSRVDPVREAERLAAAYPGEGFYVFLGLGAGYGLRPFLDRPGTGGALVVEHSISLLRAILERFDLAPVLSDRRVRLLVDPSGPDLERAVLEFYIPILVGDLVAVPLAARVAADPAPFHRTADDVRSVLSRVSDDYSVQAFFGRRWFANAVRNLYAAERPVRPLAAVREAIVTAAGPSLDAQAVDLAGARIGRYLIATDTSLGALLARGILPDAVVSIDCQHISYYHFITPVPGDLPLILDLASSPLVARRARKVHFFSSGHPFCRYVSAHFRPLPWLDTSGGNVTHAAVSLADSLGARRILLYGADFSYPMGSSYARGTYIHRYF